MTPPEARRHPVLLGLTIALVAANLRPALASVGPVLGDVRADLALSGVAAALLTAVPVFCLGALAPIAPALSRRWGMEPTVALALAVLAVGLLVRVLGGPGLLFAGTVAAAAGIAVGNVLLPAIIKRDFPSRTGTMMGVYTMALSGSAAVAAGLTVPIGAVLGRGWRGALGWWALPAALALLLWLAFSRGHSPPPTSHAGPSLLRSRLAWQVALFFGLQSLSFYAVLSWLPSIYRDNGYSPAAAGLVLSLSTLVQIPVTLLTPRFASRARDQRLHVAVAAALTGAGLAGVLVAPTTAPYPWALMLGAGQGASFAVGLTLFVLRTEDSEGTARLSALAQTFGYLLAGTGPLVVGAVHDISGSWTLPLLLLLLLLVPQLLAGVLAGRPLHVGTAAGAAVRR
jgi:CP family cyanate transporter-like MFS transporter